MTIESIGKNVTNSTGVSVQSDGTANTMGAWTELVASSTVDCEWFELFLYADQPDTGYMVDIGIGAAASEVRVLDRLSYWGNTATSCRYRFPLTIPSGTRISARCQDQVGGRFVRISGHLDDAPNFGTSPSNITIGIGLSQGFNIDPGTTLNTKGGWQQLTASSSADIDYIMMVFGGQNDSTNSNANYLIDIGTGAVSSEVVLISNIGFTTDGSEILTSKVACYFQSITAGTRISVRCQADDNTSGTRGIDALMVGCLLDTPASGGAPKQAGRGGGMAG